MKIINKHIKLFKGWSFCLIERDQQTFGICIISNDWTTTIRSLFAIHLEERRNSVHLRLDLFFRTFYLLNT